MINDKYEAKEENEAENDYIKKLGIQDRLDLYSKWANKIQFISENLDIGDLIVSDELRMVEIWIRRELEKLRHFTGE